MVEFNGRVWSLLRIDAGGKLFSFIWPRRIVVYDFIVCNSLIALVYFNFANVVNGSIDDNVKLMLRLVLIMGQKVNPNGFRINRINELIK